MPMHEINGYRLTRKIESHGFGECATFWKCEKNNTQFKVLIIKSEESNRRLLDGLLRADIKPLINGKFHNIQRVIETDWWYEKETEYMYIVYEDIDDYKHFKKDNSNAKLSIFKDILMALNSLKIDNREWTAISPDKILVNEDGNAKLAFVGLFEFFKKYNLLDEDYLSPDMISSLKNKERYRKTHQDDMYSVVKTFEPFLRRLNDESANEILKTALSPVREERFEKYIDILDLVEKINYKPMFDKVLKIGMDPEKREDFSSIFEEMNKKCYMMVRNDRSLKDGDIMGYFSTDNGNGRFFVRRDHCDNGYIRLSNLEQGKHKEFDVIERNWFRANFSFSLDDDSTNFDAMAFFEERFNIQNQLAALDETKAKLVEKWQTLPRKEREHLEKNAFHRRYDKVKFSGTKVEFFLDKQFVNWEKIKLLKNEGTILYIDDIKVGKIDNYRKDDHCIVLKDIFCDKAEIEKIGDGGELHEDVRQKTSMYKKQEEACQRFKTQDVVNPVLCSILATPETASIPHNDKILDEDYEEFKNKVFDPRLRDDETQRNAVLEALSYSPIYLIQGPPGTGKTTVIVELIRHIIKNKSDAKILITSQSNLAVDNVLEKIDKVNREENENLLFMRLASENDEGERKVLDSIEPHTYDKKLKKWVDGTIKKSNEFMHGRFLNLFFKKQTLIDFYDKYVYLNITDESFVEFKKAMNGSGNYIKQLFERAKKVDDVNKIFEKELSAEFLKLRRIQRDWFAFLSNVTTKEDEKDGKNEKYKSMLNDGSQPIDFLTAMMRKVNIIGATCIHIASSKYSKVKFNFDYVIMDESSKASPAEALVPINMGKKIVLIGDHKQLPPVVTREKNVKEEVKKALEDNGLDVEEKYGESLFEKLITAFEKEDSDSRKYVIMLNIQYRMPTQVGSLISKYFYDGKLKNPKNPDYNKSKHHGLKLKNDTSIVFISSSDQEDCTDNKNKCERKNPCNVRIIKEILAKLNELYEGNSQKEKFTIGIIAGYRGQVALLKKSIDKSQYKNFVVSEKNGNKSSLIEINTVDKFQGAERDIMIYDIVRSDEGAAPIGFLDDDRRINVAFSRMKRLLIIVGDSEYLINRAKRNQNEKRRFKEFKLKPISQELQKNGLIFNSLDEVLLV